MSIQSVESIAAEVAAAERAHAELLAALKAEMAKAKSAGVPLAAIARAAGVSRQSAHAWLTG